MPNALPHHDAILAKLQTIANLTVYDAKVDAPPLDPDGRVHPYAVLFVGAGEPQPSSLAYLHDRLDLPFQVTCAGGDMNRFLWAVDAVRGALLDQRLVVAGRSLSPIGSDGHAGPPQQSEVEPVRHFTAVLFKLISVPA